MKQYSKATSAAERSQVYDLKTKSTPSVIKPLFKEDEDEKLSTLASSVHSYSSDDECDESVVASDDEDAKMTRAV